MGMFKQLRSLLGKPSDQDLAEEQFKKKYPNISKYYDPSIEEGRNWSNPRLEEMQNRAIQDVLKQSRKTESSNIIDILNNKNKQPDYVEARDFDKPLMKAYLQDVEPSILQNFKMSKTDPAYKGNYTKEELKEIQKNPNHNILSDVEKELLEYSKKLGRDFTGEQDPKTVKVNKYLGHYGEYFPENDSEERGAKPNLEKEKIELIKPYDPTTAVHEYKHMKDFRKIGKSDSYKEDLSNLNENNNDKNFLDILRNSQRHFNEEPILTDEGKIQNNSARGLDGIYYNKFKKMVQELKK